jgi:hypothetical protein
MMWIITFTLAWPNGASGEFIGAQRFPTEQACLQQLKEWPKWIRPAEIGAAACRVDSENRGISTQGQTGGNNTIVNH